MSMCQYSKDNFVAPTKPIEYLGGLSEIMKIKSHELMILNYFLEGNIGLRNMNQTKCSAVFAELCFLITISLLTRRSI